MEINESEAENQETEHTELVLAEVEAVEGQLRLAMLSSDTDSLKRLLADDLIFTNHLGQVISKEADIAGHQSGDLDIQFLENSDCQMRLVGECVVVTVQSEIRGSYKGMEANGNFRFTRVWCKRNGCWQVVVGHSSVIADS